MSHKEIDENYSDVIAFSYFDPTGGPHVPPTKLHIPFNNAKAAPGVVVEAMTTHLLASLQPATDEIVRLDKAKQALHRLCMVSVLW